MVAMWLIMLTLTLVSSTKPLTRKQYQGDRSALLEQLKKTNEEIDALQSEEQDSEFADGMDDGDYYDATTTTTTTAGCGAYDDPCKDCAELESKTYTGETDAAKRWCGAITSQTDCANYFTFQKPEKGKRYYACGWGERKGTTRCIAIKSYTCPNDMVKGKNYFTPAPAPATTASCGAHDDPCKDCAELESKTYTGETDAAKRWCGAIKSQTDCANYFTFQRPSKGNRYYACSWGERKGKIRCIASKSYTCPNNMVQNKNYFTSALLAVDAATTQHDGDYYASCGAYDDPCTDCGELATKTYTGDSNGRWCGAIKSQTDCANYFTFQKPENGKRYYACGWGERKGTTRCIAIKSFTCPNNMVQNKNYFTSALLTLDAGYDDFEE